MGESPWLFIIYYHEEDATNEKERGSDLHF